MKFKHNGAFNDQFQEIPDIRFYPYVGERFESEETRIIVFAHNTYTSSERYESEQIRTQSKTHFADALNEYTYNKGKWTKTWRNFIKASLNIRFNFSASSDISIIRKIDEFVEKLSYTNYINDIVKSDKAINVDISQELKTKSHLINKRLIEILNITHCICWGKHVFNYIMRLDGYEVIEKRKLSKKGFGYAKIKNSQTDKIIHVLKVFHPSMPGFGVYSKKTQEILSEFYSMK